FWQMFCNQKSDNHNNKYFFVVILLFDSFDYMNVISTGHFNIFDSNVIFTVMFVDDVFCL
ncbi:MAG: hypothetical protein LBQ66_08740, partial [Planctomycetaceae bacterium]|nr:hypothetical protein [Planctomycetaceae bacterium]